MDEPFLDVVDWSAIAEHRVHDGIRRRRVTTDRFTLVRYEFSAGAVFPAHAHPESQATVVLTGTFTFDFGSHRSRLTPGELMVIPGGVRHEGRAEDGPATIVCLLTPPRRETGSDEAGPTAPAEDGTTRRRSS